MKPDLTSDIPANGLYRFTHPAMATIFEVIVAYEGRSFAEQCAHAAFEEMDRLELELSRFLPNSDISRVNNLSPGGSIQVGFDAFECLKLSKVYSMQTSGAFDITVGVLMDRFVMKDRRDLPLINGGGDQSRREIGMDLFDLDESAHKVIVGASVPRLDLGAIGKGYAVDRACELLKEWGISSALVHGGGSSAFAFGDYPGRWGWPVTISSPWVSGEILERALLRHASLSGSGVMRRKHIIDPRNGILSDNRAGAWASTPTAVQSDAVSTACMVMNDEEVEGYCKAHPETWVMVAPMMDGGRPNPVIRFGVASWEGQASA